MSLARSDAGNVLVVIGLALPVLLGVAGVGIEGATWYNTRRDMQDAADAAVVAAANNGLSAYYLHEARAVASQYGYTDNSNNTTVTASNAATCPTGVTGPCYSVTISKKVPLLFSKIVGYAGDTTVGTASAVTLTATAIAGAGPTTHQYCIIALGNGTGTSAINFQANGAPKADLTGCNIGSRQSMDCNGHDLGADNADAMGTVSGCGKVQNNSVTSIADPYASLASNIPSNTCASYPGATWSGTVALTSTPTKICGTLNISGTVTLTGTGVIVIYNGDLNVPQNATLQTGTGAGVTIIFSGSNSSSYSHVFAGGKNATLNIAAPTSGTWSGIAIYQDPSLTQNVDMDYAGGGNSPTFEITGVSYMPHADVTFSGSVNKATNGESCFILVVQTLLINGNGSIIDRGGCDAAGVTMPSGVLNGRMMLVY